MEMATIDPVSETNDVCIFNHRECPFRITDMPLPECNSGFVYMLVSNRNHYFCYIGETGNMSSRLNQHNQGYGSKTTTPPSLRPYSLFAYVCGFDGNKTLRLQFEGMWKQKRDKSLLEGLTCMKGIARLAADVMKSAKNVPDLDLRLILNFED